MKGFLKSLQKRTSERHWSLAILKAACRSLDTCMCGFSEYGSYASWMRHTRPDMFSEVAHLYRNFTPQITRGTRSLDNSATRMRACCPEAYDWTKSDKDL